VVAGFEGTVESTTETVYDVHGRVEKTISPTGASTEYAYDLVGNRLRKSTDTNATPATFEEVIEYAYDDNDRLLMEELDSDGDEDVDQTTLYEYGPNADPENGDGGDWTVLTAKTVWSPDSGASKVSQTDYEYNNQGRLETAEINSDGDANVDLAETHKYDEAGIRAGKVVQEDTDDDGDFDVTTNTDYVIDADNHTGYGQVLIIGDATLFLLRLRSRAEDNARPEKTYDPRPSAGNRVASPIISGSISGTWLGHA